MTDDTVLVDESGQLFSKEMLEQVGLAESAVSRMLQEKRNLEQAQVFLDVYKQAMLDYDALQKHIADERDALGSVQAALDDMQDRYNNAREDLAGKLRNATLEHNRQIAVLNSTFKSREESHKVAMQLIDDAVSEKQRDAQQAVQQYEAAIERKRKELHDVKEEYDVIVTAMKRMQALTVS